MAQADEHKPIITIEDPVRGIAKAEFIHKEKVNKKITASIVPDSGICWGTFATWDANTPVNYVINTKNRQKLSATFITSTIFASAETWDIETGTELFSNTYTISPIVRYGRFDGKNAIVLDTAPVGTIAVTSIWYYTISKQIVEFDIKFNTNYKWGDAVVNPAVMDLQDIATHELGHGVGLNDMYNGACNQVTMYGYGSYGEIIKRTLEAPDIEGLLSLYT